MKFFEPNEKSNTIAVYVFLVALFGVFCIILGINIDVVPRLVGFILDVIKPLLYGFMFAFALSPAVKFTEQRVLEGWKTKNAVKHTASVILVYVVVIALIALFCLTVIPQLAANYDMFVNQLRDFADDFQNKTAEFLNKFPGSDSTYIYYNVGTELRGTPSENLFPMSFSDAMGFPLETRANSAQQEVRELFSNLLASLTEAMGNSNLFSSALAFINAAKNILIGVIISIYFLIGEKMLLDKFGRFFRIWLPRSVFGKLRWVTQKMGNIFRDYVIVRLLDGFIVGILTFLCLFVFRTPFSVLLSVIVGVSSFFPFIGPIIGMLLGSLIMLIVDFKYFLVFLTVVLVINILDSRYIEPLLNTGYSHYKLSAIWVFVAIVVMGGFFGIFGIVLGIPMVAFLYSIVKELGEKELKRVGLPNETSAWFVKRDPEADEEEKEHAKEADAIKAEMEAYFAEKRDDELETQKEIKEKFDRLTDNIGEKFKKLIATIKKLFKKNKK